MGKASHRKSQSFLHGTSILTASILIIKLIGALFKVPLARVITEGSLGYFNTVYDFCGPIYSLATAGSLIATSCLVSESYTRGAYRDIRRIHRTSAPIFVGTGAVGFVLMVFGVAIYVKIIGDENALPTLYTLAPVILFGCLTAIYRGCYEGLRNMYPTAVSEVIKVLSKLTVRLSIVYLILHWGMKEYETLGTVLGVVAAPYNYAKSTMLPHTAVGMILSMTVGSLLSLPFLFCHHRLIGDGITEGNLRSSPPLRSMCKAVSRLVRTTIPIGTGTMVVNVATMVDTIFLQTWTHNVMEQNPQILLSMYRGVILQINVEIGTIPNSLFGCFSTALTLFTSISTTTQALDTSVLPSAAATYIRGEALHLRKSMEAILWVTALSNIPAGMGLVVMVGSVARLVFGVHPSLFVTSHVLITIGVGAIFVSFSTLTNSMLQMISRVDLPVKFLAVGLTIRVMLDYFLVGIPGISVLGADAGALVCYFSLMVAALIYLYRETRIMPDFLPVFGELLITSILCCTAARSTRGLLSHVLSENPSTLDGAGVTILVYSFSLLYLRAICRDDTSMLPNGQKIAKILEKHGWVR